MEEHAMLMDPSQSDLLDQAFLHSGWTPADMYKLCESAVAQKVLAVMRNEAEILTLRPGRRITIKIGVHKNPNAYRNAMSRAGYGALRNMDIDKFLGSHQFKCATEETSVNVVIASVKELGFPEGAHPYQILRRVQKHMGHLHPLTVEVALAICVSSYPRWEKPMLFELEETIPGTKPRDGNLFFIENRGEHSYFSPYGYIGSNPMVLMPQDLFVFLDKNEGKTTE